VRVGGDPSRAKGRGATQTCLLSQCSGVAQRGEGGERSYWSRSRSRSGGLKWSGGSGWKWSGADGEGGR